MQLTPLNKDMSSCERSELLINRLYEVKGKELCDAGLGVIR